MVDCQSILKMTIRFEEPRQRHLRTTSFFKFLYYDWGDDDEEDDSKKTDDGEIKNLGSTEWIIYKDVNQYETKDKFGKQALKRDFYNKQIDKSFNQMVNLGLDDDGMKNFNLYCHFFNSLGIVGYEENYDLAE